MSHSEMVRRCRECKSARPGMQPLTLYKKDGTRVRGYWHLRCFEVARKKEKQNAK